MSSHNFQSIDSNATQSDDLVITSLDSKTLSSSSPTFAKSSEIEAYDSDSQSKVGDESQAPKLEKFTINSEKVDLFSDSSCQIPHLLDPNLQIISIQRSKSSGACDSSLTLGIDDSELSEMNREFPLNFNKCQNLSAIIRQMDLKFCEHYEQSLTNRKLKHIIFSSLFPLSSGIEHSLNEYQFPTQSANPLSENPCASSDILLSPKDLGQRILRSELIGADFKDESTNNELNKSKLQSSSDSPQSNHLTHLNTIPSLSPRLPRLNSRPRSIGLCDTDLEFNLEWKMLKKMRFQII